jgi:hypothetical protein
MRYFKEISAALGSVCLGIAVAEYVQPGFATKFLPFRFDVDPEKMIVETSSMREIVPSWNREQTYTYLNVEYFSPIRIDSSVTVIATYREEKDCGAVDEDPTDCDPILKELPQPIEISLRSQAFEIDKVTQTYPLGWPLPIPISWVAIPKRTGEYKLSIDLSNVRGYMSGPVSEIKINGKTLDNTNSSIIPLAISINTGWGIPEWTANLIGLIGIVLITPTVTEVIKRIVHREEKVVKKKSLQRGKNLRRSTSGSSGVP